MPHSSVSQRGVLSRAPGATNFPSRPMMSPATINPMISIANSLDRPTRSRPGIRRLRTSVHDTIPYPDEDHRCTDPPIGGGQAGEPAHSTWAGASASTVRCTSRRNPSGEGSANGATRPAAGHALGDADQQNGRDDGDDEAEHVQLPDVTGAEQAGDDATDEGTDDAQHERHEDAQTLLTGLDEPGEGADDEADHDEAEDLHSVLLRSAGVVPFRHSPAAHTGARRDSVPRGRSSMHGFTRSGWSGRV